MNEKFRNEASLQLVAVATKLQVTALFNSPHNSRNSRKHVLQNLLTFPVDKEANRRLSNRFGSHLVRDAKYAHIVHTRFTPKGENKNDFRAYESLLILLSRTEYPKPVPSPEEKTYVPKIVTDEIYWFGFRPFPQVDESRDYFLSHLPCT